MAAPTSAVQLLGAPGLTRDVVAAHLVRHPEIELAEPPAPTAPAVCVLAEPEPRHWDTARQAGVPVVLVAGTTLDERDTVAAVVDGADAVLDCLDDGASVVQAVLTVAKEGPALSPKRAGALARALRQQSSGPLAPPALTGRETEILRAIRRGESVKQTADRLGVAGKTIENLQCRLFRKIGARNRAQAVVRGHALGLLTEAQEG